MSTYRAKYTPKTWTALSGERIYHAWSISGATTRHGSKSVDISSAHGISPAGSHLGCKLERNIIWRRISLYNKRGTLLDATRISDNAHVMLKMSNVNDFPDEVPIAEFLSSLALIADPRNHCVPIYEILRIPELSDIVIIVMPLLYDIQCPQFETIGEAVECFEQIFEGVQFIHEQNIAHGDCKYDSFMVDSTSLFSDLPHPLKPSERRDLSGPPQTVKTRTQLPVKYFIIDFNLSTRYSDAGPHLELSGWGGDKTVPEFRTQEQSDPFAVDVYCLGNSIRRYFTEGWEDMDPGKKGFEFMEPLLAEMCRDDPKARPAMPEVVSRFETIRLGLGELKLRSRVAPKNEFIIPGFFRSIEHWVRQIALICKRIAAVPKPQ